MELVVAVRRNAVIHTLLNERIVYEGNHLLFNKLHTLIGNQNTARYLELRPYFYYILMIRIKGIKQRVPTSPHKAYFPIS
jgi:hypothetical protein